MITSQAKFNKLKFNDLVSLKCKGCQHPFFRTKTLVATSKKRGRSMDFCSQKCYFSEKTGESHPCSFCQKPTYRMPSKKRKLVFCNKSCACRYRNKHKTKGENRSKLERWIENQLLLLYPKLQIKFNDRATINAELDIYFPDLRLAVELNGIFHYEPIFGEERLANAKSNDERKFQACLENGIELCIIDTRSQTYFKEKSARVFLSIITKIINKKLEKNL